MENLGTSPITDKHVDHLNSEATLHLISNSSSFPFPVTTIYDERAVRTPSRWELKSYYPLLRKVVAEMLGTFFLMFCVCGVSMSDTISHGGMSLMSHAAAAAFTIVIIIFSIGHISGAHVNPAVTLAFATMRQFPWTQVPLYAAAQLFGAVLATLLAKNMYNVGAEIVITQPGGSILRAFFMEIFIAFDFMFLASAVTSDARATGLQAAIAMGLAIALNILLAGPISGASMNPVRSLAPAIVENHYGNAWIYVLAPPLGALWGALSYKTLHSSNAG